MFVAIQRIRFGDEWLEPGDPVPVEEGRDYGLMQRLGLVALSTPSELTPHDASVRPASERRSAGSPKAKAKAKA